MQIEALLLTGGASLRMGVDKSKLAVQGVPLGEKTAGELKKAGYEVTVLGRERIPGFPFVEDLEEFAGPLAAISTYSPHAEAVFVASCDMPFFEAGLVSCLSQFLADDPRWDAAIPLHHGIRQPTCGLYRRSAWDVLPDVLAGDKRSLMAWLDRLNVRAVAEAEIVAARVDPRSIVGVNTLSELKQLLEERGRR